jgi:prepilin-type N-terminal cleavage/methylation domain-containing protein
MKIAGTPASRRAGSGFTLIELLLTLVLLLLLLGAIVLNFTGLQSGVQLDEGAEQFESLIRYARAHAANTGCKVRLTFEEVVAEDMAVPLGNVFVSWEPEPLERPGEFQPLTELSPLVDSLLGLVEVEDVRPFGASGSTELAPPEEQIVSFAPITFYPDGSSDSAEIVLAARESEDDRRLALQVLGITGTVKRHSFDEGVIELAEPSEETGGPSAN